jgi:O-antigen ligase
MINKIYTGIMYAGLTILMVFAPLARGATTTRLWAITIVMVVMYAVVFAGIGRRVNGGDNTDLGLPRRTYGAPRNDNGGRQNDTGFGRKIASLRSQRHMFRSFTSFRMTVFRMTQVAVLGFVVIAVVSFGFSIYKHDSFYALLRVIGYVGLFYVIVSNYTRRLMWYLIGIAMCMGIGLSVYGLLQYFGVLAHEWWVPKGFLAGTYVNHNHFAGYLEMVIPVAIGVLFEIHRNKLKYIEIYGNLLMKIGLMAGIVVMTGAFVFAQSRGGWICLGVSLLVMNIILIRRKTLKWHSLIILILIIAGVFVYFLNNKSMVSKRIETMIDVSQGEASMQSRIGIWQGALKMIDERPLTGVGIGCFEWGFPKYRPESLGRSGIRPRYAHNDYLHIAAEMGIPGLMFMVWILVLIIGRGIGYYKKDMIHNGQISVNGIILGCAIGMLSVSLHGLVDFNFHIPANMILFTVLGGIVVGESIEIYRNK